MAAPADKHDPSARDAWLAAQQLDGLDRNIGLATVQSRLYAWGRAARMMEPVAESFSGAPDVEPRSSVPVAPN
jgi:hypothetical protein